METLVVVGQLGNQYHTRVKTYGPEQFGSSLSKDFKGINCRSFESEEGILPTPLKAYNSTPIPKRACSSPKTPSPCSNSLFDAKTRSRTNAKSSLIPNNAQYPKKTKDLREEVSNESIYFSELWAGPAYSNSPPPSCLPIPKFSIRPKRTISLELPGSAPEFKLHPVPKSAPPSPSREHSSSTRDFFYSADSATLALRRILNLDIQDE